MTPPGQPGDESEAAEKEAGQQPPALSTGSGISSHLTAKEVAVFFTDQSSIDAIATIHLFLLIRPAIHELLQPRTTGLERETINDIEKVLP